MTSTVLGLFSCSQEDGMEANMVLIKYLMLVGAMYVLNISESEAGKVGVDAILYEGAQSEISETNKLIQELKNDSNTELELTDPQATSDLKTKYVSSQVRLNPRGT